MNDALPPFTLRIMRRRAGDAAILYRRAAGAGRDARLQRVAALSPLAFSAGAPLLRAAVHTCAAAYPSRRRGGNAGGALEPGGPARLLDADWGARVACYALVAAGLRDADGLQRAAAGLQHADGAEAAWWLGMLTRHNGARAARALRILVEAVQ
jgi:hypothetical protein